jgi:hypothetical protein
MSDGVVPPGLYHWGPPFPALKRWAKLGGPSGAGLLRLCSSGCTEEAYRKNCQPIFELATENWLRCPEVKLQRPEPAPKGALVKPRLWYA